MIKLIQTDLSDDVPYPDVDNLTLDELEDVDICGGVSLAGKFPEQQFEYSFSERPYGLVDYFEVGMLTVVSEKLKLVLESAQAEVEYFPVTVWYRRKPATVQYFAINPLVLLKAVDLARSKLEIDERLGLCESIEELVLDESKFAGLKLAMIDEIGRIGVQQELAEKIVAAGCIGCAFVEPITLRY